MAASRITGKDFAPTHTLLQQEIDDALEDGISELSLRYFFSIVKERGAILQRKFRAYQRRHDVHATFGDFIYAVIAKKPLSQVFTPEGCKYTRHPTAERVSARLTHLSDDELREAGLTEIYFGRGPAYMEVREHRCSRCPATRCMHNHPPPIKP